MQLLNCEVQKLSIQQSDSENKYKLAKARHHDIEQQLAYIQQVSASLRQKVHCRAPIEHEDTDAAWSG